MTRRALALAASLALASHAHAASPGSPRETSPVASKSAASSCPPGFAVLQDSSTCVRISGRVRADGIVGSGGTRSSDNFATQTSGRVQLDVRKQTELGPVRAVIRVEGRQ